MHAGGKKAKQGPQTRFPGWATQEHSRRGFLRVLYASAPGSVSVQRKGSHSPHHPGVAGGGGGSPRGVADLCRHKGTLVLSSGATSRSLGAPSPSADCPRHPGLCPPRGAWGRPPRPSPPPAAPLVPPTCFPAHKFPTPRSPFLAECLGPGLSAPPASSLSFIVLCLFPFAKCPCLPDLALGGHEHGGVCVGVREREREHVHDWILGRSHTWHRGMYISWGSQAQMWRSGESGRSLDSLAPPGKDPCPHCPGSCPPLSLRAHHSPWTHPAPAVSLSSA